MTKAEFETLLPGDVVENNLLKQRKVVVDAKRIPETTTQISKTTLTGQYANWTAVTKVTNR